MHVLHITTLPQDHPYYHPKAQRTTLTGDFFSLSGGGPGSAMTVELRFR
jgi:hypothetical protein